MAVMIGIIVINIKFDMFYIKTGSMEPELPVGTIVITDSHGKPETGSIFGDTELGKWIYEYLGYRSYGSMYVNEETPDGQRVNAAGIRE